MSEFYKVRQGATWCTKHDRPPATFHCDDCFREGQAALGAAPAAEPGAAAPANAAAVRKVLAGLDALAEEDRHRGATYDICTAAANLLRSGAPGRAAPTDAESLPESAFHAARMAGRAHVRAFIDPDATFNETEERGYVAVVIRTYLAALRVGDAHRGGQP